MTRAANRRGPSAPGMAIQFQPHEFQMLRVNKPGGGGYQRHENWLVANTDPATLRCDLPPEQFERTIRYIKRYGSGGPNGRIRNACIPALRRVGIELAW